MAKQIEGVYDRILECARTEFLENGYTDASLRTIASAAGTSTNSIYVRFRDKEGLFCAIVEPVVNGMTQRFIEIQERFHQMDGEEQSEEMIDYAQDGMKTLVNFCCCWMHPTVHGFTILWMSWCALRWITRINTWRPPVIRAKLAMH